MKLDNVFKRPELLSEERIILHLPDDRKFRKDYFANVINVGSDHCGGCKERSLYLSKCGGYFRVHARRRIEMITDEGSFEEWDSDLQEEILWNTKDTKKN